MTEFLVGALGLEPRRAAGASRPPASASRCVLTHQVDLDVGPGAMADRVEHDAVALDQFQELLALLFAGPMGDFTPGVCAVVEPTRFNTINKAAKQREA